MTKDKQIVLEKIKKTHNCWIWTGYINPSTGYGEHEFQGERKGAHCLIYEFLVGPIPLRLQIDHLCRNRVCVNPKHLEPVTRRENILRGIGPTALNAKKTHCLRGHPLSGSNIFSFIPSKIYKYGRRECRKCSHIRYKKLKLKSFL